MKRSAAEILREYGPFPGVDHVHGVTFDGEHVWFAAGDALKALDPASGKVTRSIVVAAHAGTAFDGRHLFQIAEDRIQKLEGGKVYVTDAAGQPPTIPFWLGEAPGRSNELSSSVGRLNETIAELLDRSGPNGVLGWLKSELDLSDSAAAQLRSGLSDG